MSRAFLFLVVILIVVAIVGCTDAVRAQYTSIGSAGTITCYSGGKEIGRWTSTGKIATEEHSDGWFFQDASTSKLIRISGNCVVVN